MEALVRILEISIQASILVGLVLLVQLLLGKWLTPAWRYGLWLLVVLRLRIQSNLQPGNRGFDEASHLVSFRHDGSLF